jgi:hypothetical protein
MRAAVFSGARETGLSDRMALMKSRSDAVCKELVKSD